MYRVTVIRVLRTEVLVKAAHPEEARTKWQEGERVNEQLLDKEVVDVTKIA